MGSFAKESPELGADLLLDDAQIGDLPQRGALESGDHQIPRFGQELLGVVPGQEPAGDDVRGTLYFACLGVDDHHRDHDTPGRKVLAVSEHDILHIPQAAPVNDDLARLLFAGDASSVGIELNDVPVFCKKHAILGDSNISSDARMGYELSKLAVDGDEVSWTHQVQHELELFGTAVSRYVYQRLRGGNDFRAAATEMVDDPRDSAFVPWNYPGREDHDIARLDRDVFVFVDGALVERNLDGYLPYQWELDPNNLDPGEHVITALLAWPDDHFGVTHLRVIVEDYPAGR